MTFNKHLTITESDFYTVSFPAGGDKLAGKRYEAVYPHPDSNRQPIYLTWFKTKHEALNFVQQFNQAIDEKNDHQIEQLLGAKQLKRFQRIIDRAYFYLNRRKPSQSCCEAHRRNAR